MTFDPAETEALTREGIEALRRGDGSTARERLQRVVAAAGNGIVPPWLQLAQACRMVGDQAGEENALDSLLAVDKRNLPALLLKGEIRARAGDDRAALSFYQAALNMAAHVGNVPPALGPALQRAEAYKAAANARFERHLLDRLAGAGLGGAPGGRIRQSLDLLIGKHPLYLQQPSVFYFPGLPQRQFYERDEFAWLGDVEAAIPAMQDELRAVVADGRDFAPYVESDPSRPRPNNPLLDDPSWGAFYFWKAGVRVEENAARCPRTMAALEAAPIPFIDRRSPMALYSLLKPGTHIQPHNGLLNTRLICHIPLVVPGDCALRVGSETREWREGEALIFDDLFEHEAWNNSTRTRIILLFEIWRPEISADERDALTTVFEAINDYQGVPEELA